jgi:hypothetical protein
MIGLVIGSDARLLQHDFHLLGYLFMNLELPLVASFYGPPLELELTKSAKYSGLYQRPASPGAVALPGVVPR